MKDLIKKILPATIACIAPLVILYACEKPREQAKRAKENKIMIEEDVKALQEQMKQMDNLEKKLYGKIVWGPSEILPCFYTIQGGDTLTTIAQQYRTTAKELARINHIKEEGKIYKDKQIMTYENCKE